jgi:hypothetical protein
MGKIWNLRKEYVGNLRCWIVEWAGDEMLQLDSEMLQLI